MTLFLKGLFVFLCLIHSDLVFSEIHAVSPSYPENQSKEEYVLGKGDDEIRYFDELVNKKSDSIEAFGLLIYKKAEDRLKEVSSIKNKSRLAFLANRLGDYYADLNINNVVKAIKYFSFSLKLKEEINEKGRPYICTKLGFVTFHNGRYALAIHSSIKAIELSDQIKNKTRPELVVVLFALNTIGNTYITIKDFKTALKYFEKAVVTSRKARSKYGEAGSLNNIGKIVSKLEGPSTALPYFKKAFRLYSSERKKIVTTHSGQIARLAINISNEYLELHLLDSAHVYAGKAIEYSSILNEKFSMLDISILQAELAFEVEDYSLAESFANEGLNNIENQRPMPKKRLYRILMNIYEKQGNLPQTLKYSKLFEAARDSIMNLERQKELITMNTKIELKKLDRESIRELNIKKAELTKVIDDSQTNKQLLYFWFGLSSLLIASFFWYRFKRHKKKVLAKQFEAEYQIKTYLERIVKLESKVSNGLITENTLNVEMINRNMEEVLHAKLTKREVDVLLELSKGKNNAEIGEALFISVNTVRTHLLKIYDKMDVKNRMQAVKKAENLSKQLL